MQCLDLDFLLVSAMILLWAPWDSAGIREDVGKELNTVFANVQARIHLILLTVY